MTADRLDLDALAALDAAATAAPWVLPIADLIETTSGLHVGDTMYVADAALIAALRNAAPALITAARERDAAQAALARVTSVENEARLVKIITDAVNKQPDNRSRALEASDGVLVALREITGEGQEAGGK